MHQGELQLQQLDVDGGKISVRIIGNDTSLSISLVPKDFFGLVDDLQKDMEADAKSEKTKKEKSEPITRFQTLTPVKFKKIKKGQTYRVTEKTSGSTVEFVADKNAEKVTSYPKNSIYYISASNEYLEFYSDEVKSVYLVEYSESF